MAITISGQNNNDKILASDGVLDQISGFNVVGVLTASTFETTGEITANHIDVGSTIQLGNAGIITATTLIGNVTGNVNSTSNLLLQISGSEKFRVGNGGQLGIGGANYGTSGQVLTSGGSGGAPTWSTISGTTINNNAANKVIMGSNTANTLEAVAKSTLFGNLSHGQNFLDDQNLIFGDGSDMILIHTSSGAKSRLRNTNDSGSLDIESTLTRFLNKDGSSEKVRITSDGKIGVNNNNPSYTLDVYGDNGGGFTATTNSTAGQLSVVGKNSAGNVSAISRIKSHPSGSGNTSYMTFETRNSSSAMVERLRIDSSGRVGINRTPALASSKLEVGGADNYPLINVEASGATAGFGIGASALRFYYGTTEHLNLNSSGHLTLQTTDAKIQLKDGNNYIQFVNADKNFKFMNAWGAGEFTFHVNGGERVRINADGDLLKGSTGLNNSSVAGQAIQISGTTRPTLIIRGNASGSNVGEIQFADNSGTDSDPGTRAGMIQYNHHGGNFMAFHVNNDSVPKFRINSWGGLSAVNSQYSGSDKSHAYYFSFHKSGTYNTFTVDIGFNSPGGYNLEMMMGGYSDRQMHTTFQGYVYDGNHYGSVGAIDSGSGPQRSFSTVSQYGSYGTKMRFQFTSMSSTHTVVEMRLTYGPAGGTSEADITAVSWS